MKTIIIQVTNEWIFLGEEYAVRMDDTNIPADHLRFNENHLIYWKVEMLSFSRVDARLGLRVVDYFPEDHSCIADQNPKYDVRAITFEPFYWSDLQAYLTSYSKSNIDHIITEQKTRKKVLEKYEKSIRLSISDITFHLGYVSFRTSIKWDDSKEGHRIPLPDSIPEYNYIKPYFTKILGRKTVDVFLEVSATEDEMFISGARSTDLLQINRSSVDVLRIGKLDHWSSRKPKYKPPDQELFTFEEAIESYGDEAFGNVDVFEKDLLFHLIEKESVRNKHQLEYLSSKVHNQDETLLMTLVPQFGFVFTHKGEEMTHMIWELLNSHATYIWALAPGSEIKQVLEQEIRTISSQGRAEYRAHFENQPDLYFNYLIHKAKSYSYEEYFERWKLSLENLLV